MAQRDYMDLLELQALIKETVSEAFPGKYWVKAEITSWSPRANGHCYLTLAQTRGGKPVAESRAMIWKCHFPQLKAFFEQTAGQALQAGITVLVRVQVNFSELYGVSLFIDDIDPAFTLGAAALERKRAIEKLEAGGYMEMQQELAFPDLPRRLAVITSKTAAGYQDFRNHLLDNPEGYAFQLDLYEALMQGEQAPDAILEALEAASGQDYDAILILRGGGSELDLSCFDNYELAVGIATCPVPVVTAIGHDKDVHIADMVAHTSVKTPTALADLFLAALRARDEDLNGLDARIRRAVDQRLHAMQQRVEALVAAVRLGLVRKVSARESELQRASARISRGFAGKYSGVERLVDGLVHRIRFAASAKYSTAFSDLALKEALISGSDPRKILGLGYVLVTGKDNKVLKTVDRVAVGDRIGVRFSDGSLTAKVDEIYSERKDSQQKGIA